MLFSNVCAVFSFSGTKVVGNVVFLALWLLLGALCMLGVLALLVISLIYKSRVSKVCLPLDVPFGRSSVGAFSA